MLNTNEVIPHNRVQIDTAEFFRLNNTSRIRRKAVISLSDRSYLPKADDPRSDWVASVTVPAFLALAQTGVEVKDFCTIGTGTGLDALAAIEILNARNIVITDLHDDVVSLARQNIIQNIYPSDGQTVYAGVGDLLYPLKEELFVLDLIYENLPNIPIYNDGNLKEGQTSSTFIAKRSEEIPEFIKRYLAWISHSTSASTALRL